MRRALTILLILAIHASGGVAHAESRYEPELPAPLCALIVTRVICYDAQTATPHQMTPNDQQVSDFALITGGGALAYRIGSALYTIGIDGGSALLVDPNAPPPAQLDFSDSSIIWFGTLIAYTTTDGLRIAHIRAAGI